MLLGFGLIFLSIPAWAANQGGPGTINYVEGQVRLDGQVLGPNAVSGSGTVVEPGRVLETGQGKTEMLLTPGVFLRLGDNSAIRLDSPALTNTQVAVLRGEVMVEADELYKENNLQIQVDGLTTRIEKNGVYAFYASPAKLAVYDGEAEVNTGDRHKTVKKGHAIAFNGGLLQETKFNREQGDGLYAWSNLRSEYLSEASVASARTYVNGGGGWYGGGWYFNPYFGAYSFLPGDGFLYSPFGWGFYSPWYVGYAPFFGGGYYGGFYGGHGYRGYPGRGIGALRSTASARSFTGHSVSGFRGGGFSGGAGFHGGGFGGGRR